MTDTSLVLCTICVIQLCKIGFGVSTGSTIVVTSVLIIKQCSLICHRVTSLMLFFYVNGDVQDILGHFRFFSSFPSCALKNLEILELD